MKFAFLTFAIFVCVKSDESTEKRMFEGRQDDRNYKTAAKVQVFFSLLKDGQEIRLCSGAVIGMRRIISIRACFNNVDELDVFVYERKGGGKPSKRFIMLSRRLKISEIDLSTHPDIAFITLEDDLNGLKPKKLPFLRNERLEVGMKLRIFGFGYQVSSDYYDQGTPLLTMATKITDVSGKRTFHAQAMSDDDVCKEDVGAPVYCNFAYHKPDLELCGLVLSPACVDFVERGSTFINLTVGETKAVVLQKMKEDQAEQNNKPS